jgi:hypothetical protein
MIPRHYVWLAWSVVLLVLWAIIFVYVPSAREKMWKISLVTMPFGLTEPLFVPRYWDPPSLFDLAKRTRFDIESLLFSFALAGICAVLYDLATHRSSVRMAESQRHSRSHQLHVLALASPIIIFPALAWLPWNPIYPAIVATLGGAFATSLCRPDLKMRMWVGGLLFLAFYSISLQLLRAFSPGYIESVWNFRALSGISVVGMPIEELLFAVAFGVFWAGLYEHMTWRAEASMHIERAAGASAKT